MVNALTSRDEQVRIVLVDDSEDTVQALALQLQIDGYSVQTATNGHDALALIDQFRPHCVLLDVVMPGMGGYELSRHLRAQYRDDIVLIAVTGHLMDSPDVAGTIGIVDHHFPKPIEFEELRKILPPMNDDRARGMG
ncbi:MAG: response regulator [Burkholderiales bacterium]